MASKAIYSVVAVVGIAAASGAAYWFQNKPQAPQEMTATGSSGALAPAGGASAAGGGRGPGGPAGVEVAKVEITKLQDDAQSVGSLRSRQNVMLRPEVAGRVQTMGFSDGGRVRKGEVLVQMDDVLQRAEVSQGLAQVSIARANLKRNQELVAQSFIAQRVVDEAAANVQVVEAQMALACARWERMRILSPFDGTAGIRNINIGDYVKDGADLVNIEDLSSMYVDFRLPERFQGKVRRDQQVELQLDAMPGRLFKAKIEAIDPQIDANGRSIGIRAVLPNTGGEPLAQRPAGVPGAPGAGASAPAGGAGTGMAKPAAKSVAKAPARAASGAVAAPRPADPIAASCAANTASMRAGAAVAGAGGSSSGARGPAGGVSGGGAVAAGAGQRGGSGGAEGTGERNASAAGGAGNLAAGQRSGATGRPAAASGAGGPGAGGGGGPLRPGMFARVTTVFNIKDKSLTVPEEAIVPQGGRQFVIKVVSQTEDQYKVLNEAAKVAATAAAASAAAAGVSAPGATPSGAPAGAPAGAGAAPAPQPPVFVDGKRLVSQRVEVKIGIRRPGRVELTEGVEEGDTVVVAGQQRLQRDNSPVRIIELGRPGGSGGPGGPGGGGAPSGAPATGAPNAAAGAVMSAPSAPAAPASR